MKKYYTFDLEKLIINHTNSMSGSKFTFYMKLINKSSLLIYDDINENNISYKIVETLINCINKLNVEDEEGSWARYILSNYSIFTDDNLFLTLEDGELNLKILKGNIDINKLDNIDSINLDYNKNPLFIEGSYSIDKLDDIINTVSSDISFVFRNIDANKIEVKLGKHLYIEEYFKEISEREYKALAYKSNIL